MIQPDTVKAVLKRKHALNFVGLDHAEQQVTHRDRPLTVVDSLARQVVGNCKETADVVRRVAPLRGKPGVVKVEPAHHRTNIEGGLNRVQLVRGAGNARTALHRGPGDDGAEHLDAGRIIEREKATAERIHETKPRRVDRFVTDDFIFAEDIFGNLLQERIRFRAHGAGRIVTRRHLSALGVD